jgi:hypothetical protein
VNLATHIRVLWRFRAVTAAGLTLAVALAILAAYKVGPGGLERRGGETWSSSSSVLVTQKGCPECRTTLPTAPTTVTSDATATTGATATKDGKVQFADPGRYSQLALLYAVMARSDLVISRLPSHPAPGAVKVTPVDATGSGNQFLPILDTSALGSSPAAARRLNQEAVDGFRNLLRKMQDDSSTPDESRVELTLLNAPSAPTLVAGRSMTPSIMAFLLCLIATLAAAHILEALRPRARSEATSVPSDLAVVADEAPLAAHLASVEDDGARKHLRDEIPPSWIKPARR